MPLPTKKSEVENNYLHKTYLIYAKPKLGKTTLVSQFGDEDKNKVLFFATEPGHKELSIYMWQTNDGGQPKTWADFRQCVMEFAKSPEFSCLAIDTAGHLVEWCANYVLKSQEKDDESEGNYGDLYRRIRREFQNVINYLGQLNKGIIFIAHTKLEKQNFTKGGSDITTTEPDLPDKYKNLFNGMVDYIFYGFTDFEGNRLLRTKATDTIVAGDRSGKLPEVMPFDAKVLIKHLTKTETQQQQTLEVMQ